MNFSLFSGDINLDGLPESIKELRIWWMVLYDNSPVTGLFVIIIFPVIVIYLIFVLGTIFKKERSTDKKVKESFQRSRKKRSKNK
jgi:membrane-anchored glycerophosphoryl diester phosphodiesterase (GDPDase)